MYLQAVFPCCRGLKATQHNVEVKYQRHKHVTSNRIHTLTGETERKADGQWSWLWPRNLLHRLMLPRFLLLLLLLLPLGFQLQEQLKLLKF